MTTIIGAKLRDGRRVVMSDGQLTKDNDTVASSTFDKVWENPATDQKRKSLVGVAGKPSELIIMGTTIATYALVTFPHVEDLFYKLSTKYKECGIECKSSACAWIPRVKPGYSGDDIGIEHVLVHITSDFFVHVQERNFVTEGSGNPEARSALLGMALRDKPADVSYDEHIKAWCPTEDDVRAAMQVAMNEDVFTGGTVFFHVL